MCVCVCVCEREREREKEKERQTDRLVFSFFLGPGQPPLGLLHLLWEVRPLSFPGLGGWGEGLGGLAVCWLVLGGQLR